MAPKAQKSKEQKAAAAAAGGKKSKKKWSKGKVKEQLNNDVMWTKSTYDKLLKEIPKSKLITPATVSERLTRARGDPPPRGEGRHRGGWFVPCCDEDLHAQGSVSRPRAAVRWIDAR